MDIPPHFSQFVPAIFVIASVVGLVLIIFQLFRFLNPKKRRPGWITVLRIWDPFLADRAIKILTEAGISFDKVKEGEREGIKGTFLRIEPPLHIQVAPQDRKKAQVYLQELGEIDEEGRLIKPRVHDS